MIVVCPSCAARFQYPDARFQGTAAKRFRCPKCGTVFEVRNPALADPPKPPVPVRPPLIAIAPAPPAPAPAPVAAPLPPPPPIPKAPAPDPVAVRPMPALPVPPAPPRPSETTARGDREALLAAAGMGPNLLPEGFRFSLAFLTGPQASTVRQLENPTTVIGREEGDVIVNDPEISRRHARIEIRSDGTAWLADLNSTNGTFTGGKPIEGPTRLLDRQEFSCGKSTFMVLIRPVDPMAPDAP